MPVPSITVPSAVGVVLEWAFGRQDEALVVPASQLATAANLNPYESNDAMIEKWMESVVPPAPPATLTEVMDGFPADDVELLARAIESAGLGQDEVIAVIAEVLEDPGSLGTVASRLTRASAAECPQDLVEISAAPAASASVEVVVAKAARRRAGDAQESAVFAARKRPVSEQHWLPRRDIAIKYKLAGESRVAVAIRLCGRADGLSDGQLIEVKSRAHRLRGIPESEKCQLEAYLWLAKKDPEVTATSVVHIEQLGDERVERVYKTKKEIRERIVIGLGHTLADLATAISATWAPPTLGHIKQTKGAPGTLYIGRRNHTHSLEESPWANPYHLDKRTTREAVIALYREYIVKSPDLLVRLPELAGKTLACWCSPKACHGDVLVELFEALRQNCKARRDLPLQ